MNPNGQRPIATKASRTREPHLWQLIDTRENYATEPAHGLWSEFENIVFSNIIRYMESNEMEVDSVELCTLFDSVTKQVHSSFNTLELPADALLRPKSLHQISNKIKHFLAEKSLFVQISHHSSDR